MKRALSACASIALLTLGLVACGSEAGKPGPSASSTTSVSASASPTPTASAAYKPATATSKAENVPVPVMPAAAKAKTPEGAKAFVGYWVAMLSYAYETGDTKTVSAMSAPDCQLCQTMISAVQEQWHAGGWIEGGKLRTPAGDIKVTPNSERVTLIAQVIQEPFAVHDAKNSVTEEQKERANLALAFVVDRVGDSWKIHDTKRWVG
ncbi:MULTISPECIES: DUF6318 family protein [Arthrobacter]|uniref:DUF6318 family protein n=2 Tax=Arthrobacter TaxID=1663 RepID=A0ABU9KQS5_9MICC|nr:DUF6318 family protein [Arthrobacter sp. YJM1]MDP5228480.1 DUF6318 family protein [Arthrobacter sp. YJM1]